MAQLQATPAARAPPVVVVVNGLADLILDTYLGDDMSVDIEEIFDRFANNAEQVAAIKYVLSGTAPQWFNDIPPGNMPATINNLQCDFFAKFRIAKTRLEWKKEQIYTRYKHAANDKQIPTLLWQTTVATNNTDREGCKHLANATQTVCCI